MLVLGIETSCDETAAALVTETGEVRASVVASQLKLHAPFGGIVPELASRQHLRDIPRVTAETFRQAGAGWKAVEGVAVTHGPGLMGSLLVGLSWAKAAAWARSLPFIGVNHLEGHLTAVELDGARVPRPFLGLVASGGHTNLYLAEEGPAYRLLAATRDDAVGEAFDKAAKLLGLPYPGGPSIEKTARGVEKPHVRFTVPRMKDGSWDFSYSGLKTAVRNLVTAEEKPDPAEVAAAFQQTLIKDLVSKTFTAVHEIHPAALVLSGGVAANKALREAFAATAAEENLPFFCPPIAWCTDNAAMIGLAGARRLADGQRSNWDLVAEPNLQL